MKFIAQQTAIYCAGPVFLLYNLAQYYLENKTFDKLNKLNKTKDIYNLTK